MTLTRRVALSVLFAAACAVAGPSLAQTPADPASPAAAPAPTPPTIELREDGLIADWFAADPAKAVPGAVIVLGGSEGGLSGSRNIARRLAAEGISALAVSYFGEPGQSAKLDLIPIEPVDRALAWLADRPDASGPVGVIGLSKGAELALLAASRTPALKAVVAAVPTHVLWQGIDMAGGPTGASWTSGGRPLPYVAYDLSKGFNGVYRLYVDSLPSAPAEAEIPVERIAGPILLVSGEADNLWPSTDMSNHIQKRLEARGFAHPVTHLAYPGAGHAVFGPPIPAPTPAMEAQLPFLGGTMPALVAARADGWPRVVAFLKTALAGAD